MRATLENMHLGRHSSFMQGQIECEAVLCQHFRIAAGGKQKRWRSLRLNPEFIGKLFAQLGVRILSQQVRNRALVRVRRRKRNHRIPQNQEVRPATQAVSGIGGGWVAGVKMSRLG